MIPYSYNIYVAVLLVKLSKIMMLIGRVPDFRGHCVKTIYIASAYI